MIKIDFYKGQVIGVYGLGRTGLALIESLLAGDATIIAWDDNRKARSHAERLFPAIKMTPPSNQQWMRVKALMPSPAIQPSNDLLRHALDKNIEVIGDIELYGRYVKWLTRENNISVRLIAITGTNGKSTTTKMIADMLAFSGYEVQMAGNIGLSPLAQNPPRNDMIVVLEISSYQAHYISNLSADIAIQLNLTPDHKAWHGSLKAYADAKARLFHAMKKNGRAVIGVGDRFGQALASQLDKSGYNIIALDKIRQSMPADIADLDLPTPALHKDNIAACWAVARYFDIGADQFKRAVAQFEPLDHRCQTIAHIGKVRFIDDSKATNAHACLEALRHYRDIYWLAGGADKQEGFDALNDFLNEEADRIRHVFLFGQAANRLSAFLGKRVRHSLHRNLKDAVQSAYHQALQAKNGVVLLSPSCASFDEFQDFAQRGRAFASMVRGLASKLVVMAAGGTGGGLFPAQALADNLNHKAFSCLLMTDNRVLAFTQNNIWMRVYHCLSSPFPSRANPLLWLKMALYNALGVIQALALLLYWRLRFQKLIVIGFGGYPSLPSTLAAVILRIPLHLHEPGAFLGRANRLLLPFAQSLSSSLPCDVPQAVITGNPLRPEIKLWRDNPYEPFKRSKNQLRLVIFGGSQGAAIFDDIVPLALEIVAQKTKTNPSPPFLHIVQQSRLPIKQRALLAEFYRQKGISAKLNDFFSDLARHISQAHLIIARGGASTIAELAFLGRPAIIIPIQGAPSKEQQANAQSFVQSGAGWMMMEKDFTAQNLALKLKSLIASPNLLTKAANAAKVQSQDYADMKLADLITKRFADA